MSKQVSITTTTILGWAIAGYSIITGIMALAGWDSAATRFGRSLANLFGQTPSPLPLIMAIVLIVSGLLLAISSLGLLKAGINTAVAVFVFLAWVAHGVIALVLGEAFRPEQLGWWQSLSWYVIICLAVWICRPAKS